MIEKKTFKWSKLILAVSLGLNLIVAGLLAGAWFNAPKQGARGDRGSYFSAGPFGRALSKEDRKMMGDAFRNDPKLRDQLGKGRGEMRRIGLDVVKVLRSDPLDATALTELFDEQAQLGNQLQTVGRRALLDRIIAMSQQERSNFADKLENGVKRGGKRNRN